MASCCAIEASSFLEATRPLFLCCRLAACSCNRLHCALASTSSSWLGLGIGFRVRLRPPPGKGYLSICRVTLLQPLYMSRLVGGSRWSDRAGLRMAREQAQACRASWRYGAGWGLAVRLTGWRRTACGMSTDMSGDKVSAPRETSCSRLAARSRAIICISIRSCSTDSCVLLCFSRSNCRSR